MTLFGDSADNIDSRAKRPKFLLFKKVAAFLRNGKKCPKSTYFDLKTRAITRCANTPKDSSHWHC